MRLAKIKSTRITVFMSGILRKLRGLWAIFMLFLIGVLMWDAFRLFFPAENPLIEAPEMAFWEKKDMSDPAVAEEQKRLEEFQKVCPHIHEHNTWPTYYCPLCRKKMRKEKPLIWF